MGSLLYITVRYKVSFRLFSSGAMPIGHVTIGDVTFRFVRSCKVYIGHGRTVVIACIGTFALRRT